MPGVALLAEEASCCQSDVQVEKPRIPQASAGRLLLVAGSVGSGPQVPNRYVYHPQGPPYTLCDQTLLLGVSRLSGGVPGKLETALRLESGLVLQPASQDGHAVKEELLIIAFAPRCVSNGASPDTW